MSGAKPTGAPLAGFAVLHPPYDVLPSQLDAACREIGDPQWSLGRPRLWVLRLWGEPPVEFRAAAIAGGRSGLILALGLALGAKEAQMEMIVVSPPWAN